jgi:hypothetical protein
MCLNVNSGRLPAACPSIALYYQKQLGCDSLVIAYNSIRPNVKTTYLLFCIENGNPSKNEIVSIPVNLLACASVKAIYLHKASASLSKSYRTITVIVNIIEGIAQGGVKFRHSGFPVMVNVEVPLANAKYPACAPAITVESLIEAIDQM